MITDGPEAADLHQDIAPASLVGKVQQSIQFLSFLFTKEYALPIFDQLGHPMVFCNFFEADEEGFLKRPFGFKIW